MTRSWSDIAHSLDEYPRDNVREVLRSLYSQEISDGKFPAGSACRKRVTTRFKELAIDCGWLWLDHLEVDMAVWNLTGVFEGQDGRRKFIRKGTIDAAHAFQSLDYILEWIDRHHGFLCQLRTLFDVAGSRDTTETISAVIATVEEGTDCDDAWYGTLGDCLLWYCQATGVSPRALSQDVKLWASLNFESWVPPSNEQRTAAAAAFAKMLEAAKPAS